MSFVIRGELDTNGTVLRLPAGSRGAGGVPSGGQYAFTGGAGSQIELYDKNRVLAKLAQESIGQALKDSIEREPVTTDRLFDATMNSRNIVYTAQGFGVGNRKFLDGSNAKYWRTIDQGTAAVWKHPFVGKFYYVVRQYAFGASIGGFNTNGAVAGPAFGPVVSGAGGQGKFNPMSFAKGRDWEAKGARWLGKVFITKDIAPHNYYLNGFREAGIMQRAAGEYSHFFRKLLP